MPSDSAGSPISTTACARRLRRCSPTSCAPMQASSDRKSSISAAAQASRHGGSQVGPPLSSALSRAPTCALSRRPRTMRHRSPFVDGWSHDTGLPDGCADVVIVSQALHWMEPSSTFEEVGRLLRPAGVFAAMDCDWPPSVGSARAEAAWQACRARVRAYDERLAAGARGDRDCAPPFAHLSPAAWLCPRRAAGAHMSAGVRGGRRMSISVVWSTAACFGCHEVVVSHTESGDADRSSRCSSARATTRRCGSTASTTRQ